MTKSIDIAKECHISESILKANTIFKIRFQESSVLSEKPTKDILITGVE